MPDDKDAIGSDLSAQIVRFPQSRVKPAGSSEPFRELGTSQLSQSLGLPERQATGHWCSRCRGIWYGYLLEVTGPACGNRHG
ncbi:hypothetical protein ACVWWG_009467 [Bradyrhizobium sp. LB7.2]